MKKSIATASLFALLATMLFAIPAAALQLPDPDGKPADMSKKVKVFIIMGQSNTLEMGKVKGDKEGSLEYAVKNENLYPFMVDGEGNWTKRQDVRNVHTMGSGGPEGRGGVRRNDWLTVSAGKIGIFDFSVDPKNANHLRCGRAKNSENSFSLASYTCWVLRLRFLNGFPCSSSSRGGLFDISSLIFI